MSNPKAGEMRNHLSTGFKVIESKILMMTVPENKRNVQKTPTKKHKQTRTTNQPDDSAYL